MTVDARMEWRALFGTPRIVVSYMASHSVSTTIKEFARQCNMQEHITTAYGYYNNGSIEVINKIYLDLMRALLSELRWDKEYWPWLNRIVEHTINHHGQSRFNGNAPITVMTVLQPDNPFDDIFKRPGITQFSKNSASQDQIQKQKKKKKKKKQSSVGNVEETEDGKTTEEVEENPNFGVGD